MLTTGKRQQWLLSLPSRQSCLNNTLIADGKPTSGIFNDPVMNFMSCVALTGQVTITKKRTILKAQLLSTCSKNVLSLIIVDMKVEINTYFLHVTLTKLSWPVANKC